MALILYITNLPTPYRLPLYRIMGAMVRNRGHDLHLFFLGYSRSIREWRVPPEDMHGIRFSSQGKGHPGVGALRAIRELRPSAVVLSWAMDHVALALLLYCRLRHIPCYVVSGETMLSAAGNPWRLLRRMFREPFFRLASGFITYGVRSAEYLLDAGVPPERVTTGVNVADMEYFRAQVEELRRDGRAAAHRDRYRHPSGSRFVCHLLFVGYFLPSKGILEMIRALRHLGRSDIVLHIVGSGGEQGRMHDEIAALGLEENVIVHGYRQQSALPIYYASADVLVFPSLEEVFGLVMAEGAAAGLPIIASHYAGGVPEVVEDGLNGIVIDPRDLQMFAAAIARLADDPELRHRMGEASRRRAEERLTVERSALQYLVAMGLA